MNEPELGLLVLRTSHMAGMLDFYRAMGLTFAEERHGSGPVHYSSRIGATVLEIYLAADQEPRDHARAARPSWASTSLLWMPCSPLEAV
jgi:hypothetical protein